MQPIRNKLARVFAQILELPEDSDVASASMETVPNWDSMAHINLIVSVEQEFRVAFTPDEAAYLTSFAEFETLVQRKLAGDQSEV